MTIEANKKRASLNKQEAILIDKLSIIEAKYTKDIWTDSAYDKDRKDTLRKAEHTLRLSQDSAYQALQKQYWDLKEQLDELGQGLYDNVDFDLTKLN